MATYIGTTGSDFVSEFAGYDYLYGADGNDTLGSNRPGLDVIEGGRGSDVIYMADGFGGFGHLYGADGNDTLQGASGGDALFGGLDADVLYGLGGADGLDGGDGDDLLFGGSGDDFLTGGGGSDVLYGEAGNDGIATSLFAFSTAYGGSGNDFMVANGSDVMYGEEGSDVLLAGTGVAYYFDGGAGDDYLFGSDNTFETLVGGPGVDVITGDRGVDFLYGGSGFDYFFLSPDVEPGGIDYIFDWRSGGTPDGIILDNAYGTSTSFVQAGADTYVVVPQGTEQYIAFVANSSALDVQVHTYFV